MTTWKQALSILAAFVFGAFAAYDVMSHQPRSNPQEEWGVVAVHFGRGPNLWGLFESKDDCLKARTAYRDLWALAAGAEDEVAKKGQQAPRVLILESGKDAIPVTFSCLPLSEIRGLALDHARSN